MKRKMVVWLSAVMLVVVFLCLAAATIRYVDIPGTEWDNSLDLRPVIMWELKVKAR